MGKTNEEVCHALAKLQEDGYTFDPDDDRSIWVKVFKNCIFQVSLLPSPISNAANKPISTQVAMSSPYYWVIDAMDECVKYAELFALLKGAMPSFPLRLFITSRKLPDMPRISRCLERFRTTVVEIPVHDTMRDIGDFIRSQMDLLCIDGSDEQDTVPRLIQAKSGASFLWVRLVMDELQTVYAYETMLDIINDLPEGMVPYYRRMVSEMAENKRECSISRGILLWVVSASRPLTVKELSHALQLDINIRLPSATSAIEGLCRNLVRVSSQSGFVHI
ncbi:hypothetical protein IMZ48_37965, partial [Candidatus Bathyarchaeota archaeon]|nr:hypothetical protein [Candidatus Bathyarchaeota archaeon]